MNAASAAPAALRPRHTKARVYPPIPADLYKLLTHGKLDQICPECGREEAAHWYCSLCLCEMGPDDWHTWAELHPERAQALRERALASGSAERFAAARARRAAASGKAVAKPKARATSRR